MGLYNNIVQWTFDLNDYDLNQEEHVAWIKNPFFEYKLDPIFKVIAVYDDFTFDLECVKSEFMSIGSIYLKQPWEGFRRVKYFPINEDLQYDHTGPTVIITSSAPNSTNISPIPITLTFSQDVLNFKSENITVNNGIITNFQGSGSIYTADVVPNGDGLVEIILLGSKVRDIMSNGNIVSNTIRRIYDTTSPTVELSSLTLDPTSVNPIPVNITFSEDVTGFVIGDITVTNGVAGNFVSISSKEYTIDVTPNGIDLITVYIAGGVVQDLAGNFNLPSLTLSRNYI